MRPRSVSDEQNIVAARACLLAHGPTVTLAAIGKRVGISGPAVLRRFGSKKDLVAEALQSGPFPDWSHGPDAGPLWPQLVALLLHTERVLLEAAPKVAMLRTSGIVASRWPAKPYPHMARRNLRAWLEQARRSHGFTHSDLETAADLLISLVEARGFLGWVDPTWVKEGDEWAARAVDTLFGTSGSPKAKAPSRRRRF